MKPLFIIPARGGSKGIPRKNVRPFLGTPLIAISVRQALKFAAPDDVCVTTDNAEIADAAAAAGAIIRFVRPAHLASDTASSRDVMLHALDCYNAFEAEALRPPYDTIVLLQPTSPLRDADDIRTAISEYRNALEAGRCPDMAVSVTEASANPYYDAFETDAAGFLHISKGDGGYTRRQDAPKVWQYNGAVYVINAQSLRDGLMSRFKKIIPVPMPRHRSADLDTETDWLIAEIMAGKSQNPEQK